MPVVLQIIPDHRAAAGDQRRGHAGAAHVGVILASDGSVFGGGESGVDAGAWRQKIRLDAPVEAGSAGRKARHALVHAVVGIAAVALFRAVAFRSAHRDDVLGAGSDAECALRRQIHFPVGVAGGEADGVVLVVPDDLVVEARAGTVVAVAGGAPRVVHDAGALIVGVLQVFLGAGTDVAALQSGAENEERGVAGHAAELAVAGGAGAGGGTGHVRAVVAGVVPFVIGAPFPGDARGVAALDGLVFEVGVDVVQVAVVKAGILDADHLVFAGVAFQLHVVDVAGVVRPGLVVENFL